MIWRSEAGKILQIEQGDITRVEADAIVNAANSHLAGGGGVDGAIHRAAGPEMRRELDAIQARIGTCPTGQAVATGAGLLPARFIFHTVGPVWSGGGRREAELLASCYRVCLAMAEERGLESIAFPAISTGVYGYPMRGGAEIAIGEIRRHLMEGAKSLGRASLVLFGEEALRIHEAVLRGGAV